METKIQGSELLQMIKLGETQTQDFKFAINDSKKIAKSLSAFANTDGGKLLVGVKDNGKIAGINPEEEYYMIEAAAQLYCKPIVNFYAKVWTINDKKVLEINIPKGKERPYCAKNNNNQWLAYIRVKDENILADRIIVKSWQNEKKHIGIKIKYNRQQEFVLKFIEENGRISTKDIIKYLQLPKYQAENILIQLMSTQIIMPSFEEQDISYVLKKNSVSNIIKTKD